jgi:hypothetical protein
MSNSDEDYKKFEEEFDELEQAQGALEETEERWTARRAMLGAMLTNFCVGSYFVYGNFNPYVAEWLKQKDASITSKNTLLIQPVWLSCQTLITTVGLVLADKFGFRTVVYASVLGYCLVNFLTAYCHNYLLYTLVYGIGSGTFLGLGYLLSLYIAWTYYPNSKSIVTGLVLFATGLSPSILAPVTTLLLNPDDEEILVAAKNVPKMFRALAGIFGGVLLLIVLVLPPPKKSLELKRKTLMKKLGKTEEEINPENEEDIDNFLQSGANVADKGDSEDKKAIDDIPVEDSPVDNGETLAKPALVKIGSGKVGSPRKQSSVMDEKRLTGTYRNSIAYLQTQKVFSDINNMVASESMVLMYGMGDKYVDNLKSLQVEKEENRRRTMGFQERKRWTERKSISAQKNLMVLRQSLMKAKTTNKNISEILPRETIAKIVTENADEMAPEEVEDIAEQLIESQCPDMKTGMLHPNFFLLVIMCIGSTVYNFFMNAAWKDYAESQQIQATESQLSLILTIAAIFEAVSGLIAGGLLLFLPFKVFYIVQVLIQTIAVASIYSVADSYITITVYFSLSMYLLGSDKTVFPTITQKIFGPIAGPKIYPFVYVFFAVSSFLQFSIYNWITQDFKTIFMIFTALAACSFLATFFIQMKPTWVKKASLDEREASLTDRFMKASEVSLPADVEEKKEREVAELKPTPESLGVPDTMPMKTNLLEVDEIAEEEEGDVMDSVVDGDE